MSEILYNFGANAVSIQDVNSQIQSIREVQADIGSVFTTLATVYEGEGALALNEKHRQIDALLEELLDNTTNTQRNAQDQQDMMQSLDRSNASAF
ncbi:hypothetical protein BH11ACT6_BH11ACT6_35410 [soil metagenome]